MRAGATAAVSGGCLIEPAHRLTAERAAQARQRDETHAAGE
jgi:hypothetical protein